MMVLSSRVDQPPVSGVPVAGATEYLLAIVILVDAFVLLTCGIKRINVQRQVYWPGSSNTVPDLLDNSLHSNCVDFTRFNDFKSAVPIVLVVARSAECGSDTSVDVGIISKQTFLGCVVKVCAMVDAGYLAGRTSKNLWLPCIQMGIEMDDSDGAISSVD